jgi:hypothetical protein
MVLRKIFEGPGSVSRELLCIRIIRRSCSSGTFGG